MPKDLELGAGLPTTYNILFVCTGNTCRSPMAEAIAQQELERRGWRHVVVGSAGVAAQRGTPASELAIRAVAERGLDLSAHRARALDRETVDWADVILAMSPSHLAIVDELGGAYKAALLGDFAEGYEGAGTAVSDPFGGDVATYRATLSDLDLLVGRALDRLTAILHP